MKFSIIYHVLSKMKADSANFRKLITRQGGKCVSFRRKANFQLAFFEHVRYINEKGRIRTEKVMYETFQHNGDMLSQQTLYG